MNSIPPFHLAFPVNDIIAAKKFYGGVLGLEEGRSSETWIDYNLFGHQVVAHLSRSTRAIAAHNPVDGHDVPVPHFGVILSMDQWERLRDRLIDHGVEFVIEPYKRFEGEVGEQATMFFLDPSGNALEFKAFADSSQIFAKGRDFKIELNSYEDPGAPWAPNEQAQSDSVIEVAAKMGYATMASPALAGAALIGAAIMDRGMKITPYRSQGRWDWREPIMPPTRLWCCFRH